MTTEVEKVLSLAADQVGYHESYSNGHWTNGEKYAAQVPGLAWANYQAWCATFVSWLATKAGVEEKFPITASCLTGVAWFKKRGRFNEYPAVGAQVFYGPGGGSHTGIVVSYDDTSIHTIEGNTNTNGSPEGDGVYRRTRARRDDYVYGYGYPDYAEGIKSADPAWKGKAPVAPAKPPTHPVWDGKSFPGAGAFVLGKSNPAVTLLGQRLVAHGYGHFYKVGPGPVFGQADGDATAAFERAQGWSGSDANGIPGPETWARLMAAPRKVTPKPVVFLAHIVAAAKKDPGAAQGHQTYASEVRLVEAALKAEGLLSASYASDGSYGTTTIKAYAAWQRRSGVGGPYDGIPGIASMTKLGAKHGFAVRA